MTSRLTDKTGVIHLAAYTQFGMIRDGKAGQASGYGAILVLAYHQSMPTLQATNPLIRHSEGTSTFVLRSQ
ncbi:hypothetical protein CCR84_05205 [Rhodocyclus purpureus]|nr:hypothetical protein [Rhodocyclus purpureus]